MGIGLAVQAMLSGMPVPADLTCSEVDGRTLIMVGATVMFDYAAGDTGLRNLAAVTLPELGFTGRRVAELLGITEVYVSMLRGRARRDGSSALLAVRGRRPSLSSASLEKARRWRADGESDMAIGRRLGVHATTVARALARSEVTGPVVAASPVQVPLSLAEAAPEPTGPAGVADADVRDADLVAADVCDADLVAADVCDADLPDPVADPPGAVTPFSGSARIATGGYRSRYAGATLLYPYLGGVGVERIFASLKGAPARRYDDLTVLVCATVGFALGVDSVEGAKHLRRGEAGAALGVTVIPQLATLRGRLSALGDRSDPLVLQRAFAAGMVAFDGAEDPVYFVDDHFVAYSGARPVAKGWNTKRRHAQPGRDDTVVVDARGRAVVFSSAEPTGLSSTLPGVLAQLCTVVGPDAPILIGFDRGGAYPAAFAACRAAGADWVTYRRAPLIEATVTPKRSWTVRDGRRVTVTLADETVQINNYGACRQLTLFEHGKAVLQVLTSDTAATGADLLCWLRARWRIDNFFKYAAEHNGIDALGDYRMDIGPDNRMVANPARLAARATLAAADTEQGAAERALAQLLAGSGSVADMNNALPEAHSRITEATVNVEKAKTALRPIPAKVAATALDSDAKRAQPRLERRGLQMVLRLLAFNAEAWLAEHLNAYLADPDEYRAIARNLLHLGGNIDYTADTITVTLDRPDSPRVNRSLELLAEELNNLDAHLPGDHRPLTYQVTKT